MANTIDNMDRCGVAWFKFDEASGNVTDSKSSVVGTISGGVSRVTGWGGIGNALSFNGSNGYVQFNSVVIPVGKKSIRFRVKRNSLPVTNEFIFSNIGTADTNNGLYSYLSLGNGHINFRIAKSAPNAYVLDIGSTINVCDGNWHDILFTWDGTVNTGTVKIYIDDMVIPNVIKTASNTELAQPTRSLTIGRLFETTSNLLSGQIDNFEVYNDVISGIPDLTLIYHQGEYKYYLNDTWQSLGNTISDSHFKQFGMVNISTIPEDAWKLMHGEIELCTWTDAVNKNQISYSVTTEPFTLGDEWANKEVQIIEYTDDPNQTESLVTLETDPFTAYDELGDSVDVLYYTDDLLKNSAELNIIANYSPLDDISEDFEVVSYIENLIEETNPTLNVNALPKGQLVIKPETFSYLGEIESFVSYLTKSETEGVVRFILSFDGGTTWESYSKALKNWIAINISNIDEVVQHGMFSSIFSSIPSEAITNKSNGNIKLGIYIEESLHITQNIGIDYISYKGSIPKEDVKFSDMAFYILNTTAIISVQFEFGGNKLTGELDDADSTKIQYRVILNGNPYYPNDGSFTRLNPPPLNIEINVSERYINFDEENVLRVEFKDSWGEEDFWETTFIGTYSGIMFKDETGTYLSNSFGEILKHLDFGDIIAGQTTLEQKVIVKNQMGVQTQNLILNVMKDKLPTGVNVQLSRSNFPFVAEDPLLFNMFFDPDQEFEFYVRISTDVNATATPNGEFEVRANTDPV